MGDVLTVPGGQVYPALPANVPLADGPSVNAVTTGTLAAMTFYPVAHGATELQMLVSQGVAAAVTADAAVVVIGKVQSTGDLGIIGEYTITAKTGTNRLKSSTPDVYITQLVREIPIAGWDRVGFFIKTATGTAGTLRYRTF